MSDVLNIELLNQEISLQLSNAMTARALVETTFKGLDEKNMRKAILE
jgi:hypothetical protein